MSTVGRRLLSSLIYSADVQTFIKLSLDEEIFRESEVELYQVIQAHLMKYGKLPAINTIEQMGFSDALTEAPEPPQFYFDEVQKRFIRTTLKKMVTEAHQLLADESDNDAYDLVMAAVSNLQKKKHKNKLLDFRDAEEIINEEYKNTKLLGNQVGMMFGWPRLDSMTGGLRAGDVCSIVGRPASGKTFKVLYVAHHNWMTGNRPLVVSMEMQLPIISQRLAAMNTSTNLTQLIKAELSTAAAKSMKGKLKALHKQEQPFWLVDGNLTATVDDIVMLANQLKPSSLLIDGAYLLRHPNPRISKFDKLTENAEGIKQRIAQDLGIPTVVSYQFSREATKKKKDKEKAGLEDIYGTDAIGQLSSVVLGLMEAEGIETQKRRHVTILKGRNGETGGFEINWDFHRMNFAQVLTEDDIKDQDIDPDPSQYVQGSDLMHLG